MYSFFFVKGNEQRRWVVIFSILIPLLFSIWGIFLSRQANRIAKSTADNREQIETLASMIKKIQVQTDLLQRSVAAQESQLILYRKESEESKRLIFIVTEEGGDDGDKVSSRYVSILNSGGDAFNFSYSSVRGAVLDKDYLPGYRQIPSGSKVQLHIVNITQPHGGVTLRCTDRFLNEYIQDLLWTWGRDGFKLLVGAVTYVGNKHRIIERLPDSLLKLLDKRLGN